MTLPSGPSGKPQLHGMVRCLYPAMYDATPDDAITAAQRTARLQAMIDDAEANALEWAIPRYADPYLIDDWLYFGNAGTNNRGHFEGILKSNNAEAVWCIGNHHPAKYAGLSWWDCGDPALGADRVTVASGDKAAAVAAISVGTMVLVRSAHYFQSSSVNPLRMSPLTLLAAHAVSVDETTGVVILDRALDIAPEGGAYITTANQATQSGNDGRAFFMADGLVIEGGGGIETTGTPAPNGGGMLDAHINIGSMKGEEGFYFNTICSSHVHAEHITVTRKLFDLAGMSHHSTISWGRADILGAGDDVAAGAFNECARAIRVRGGSLIAGEFVGNGNLIAINGGSRGCSLDIDRVVCPAVTASILQFNNAEITEDGDIKQYVTHDNRAKFGIVTGGASTRYVSGTDQGGENKRNHLDGGRFFGAITGDHAVEWTGDDFTYSAECQFENGDIYINGSAV